MSTLSDFLQSLPNIDWADTMLSDLAFLVDNMDDGVHKTGANAAVEVLSDNKDTLSNMSKGSLLLFVSYIAVGKTDDAMLEYLRNDASVDELISGMLNDALAVSEAKLRKDQLEQRVWDFIKLITIEGAKKLLPLLILAL